MGAPTMAQRIYTLDQVAELLDMHRNTIRQYILDGKLIASQIGGRYRIQEKDLEDFLRRTQIKPKREENQG